MFLNKCTPLRIFFYQEMQIKLDDTDIEFCNFSPIGQYDSVNRRKIVQKIFAPNLQQYHGDNVTVERSIECAVVGML